MMIWTDLLEQETNSELLLPYTDFELYTTQQQKTIPTDSEQTAQRTPLSVDLISSFQRVSDSRTKN